MCRAFYRCCVSTVTTILTVKQQSFSNGIDCLEFEENAFGVKRIFFDISRRFEVGYGIE